MSSKEKPRIRWTPGELAQAWKIVHYQDVLITGLTTTTAELSRHQYGGFWDFKHDQPGPNLVGILHFAGLISKACNILLRTRDGKPGANPKWYPLTEEVQYFTSKIFEVAPVLAADVRLNNWEVIEARLVECKAQCRELQKSLTWLMPADTGGGVEQINEEALLDWLSSADTINEHMRIRGSLGDRYKRRR